MFTYLNHRYGLKTLIVETASALLNALKVYSVPANDLTPADCEILLFSKILRNECDEDFRHI